MRVGGVLHSSAFGRGCLRAAGSRSVVFVHPCSLLVFFTYLHVLFRVSLYCILFGLCCALCGGVGWFSSPHIYSA